MIFGACLKTILQKTKRNNLFKTLDYGLIKIKKTSEIACLSLKQNRKKQNDIRLATL
jgi:hypothetical protein